MSQRLQQIHAAIRKSISQTSLKTHNPRAVEMLKQHGIFIAKNIAFS